MRPPGPPLLLELYFIRHGLVPAGDCHNDVIAWLRRVTLLISFVRRAAGEFRGHGPWVDVE